MLLFFCIAKIRSFSKLAKSNFSTPQSIISIALLKEKVKAPSYNNNVSFPLIDKNSYTIILCS